MKWSVFALATLLSLQSYTQPPAGEGTMDPPPEFSKNPENSEGKTICQLQTEWLNKKLKLEKEQLHEVEKIIANHVNKRLALKRRGGNKDELAASMVQNDLERDQSLKKMLTEKQFNRYLKQKQVLENSFDNVGSGGMPPPSGL